MKTYVFDTETIIALGTQLKHPYLVKAHADGSFECSCKFGQHNSPMRVVERTADGVRSGTTCRHVRAILREEERIRAEAAERGEGAPPYDAATASGMYDRD